MKHEHALRLMIRKLIEEELQNLQEMSTSDGAGPYQTPFAFSGRYKAKRKSNAEVLGYRLTHRGKEELARAADKLHEGTNPYHSWKKDETTTPHAKIARVVSELNKNIGLMEKMLRRSGRLQTELNIPSETLYRRTQEAMLKLESRMIRLVEQLRELRGK
jgi:hypothetical protein